MNLDYETLLETELNLEHPALYLEDEELDLFLGNIVSGIGKAVGSVGKAVGSTVQKLPFAKDIGKAVKSVGRALPLSLMTNMVNMSPMGMVVRAGLGAIDAAANGKNLLQGAVRGLAPDPVTKFYVDTGFGVSRGENVLQAAKRAGEAGIKDAREALRYGAMVAPFVPGIGSGVAAALGAANAIAAGEPITEAVIAAARDAVPGGAIAQAAFDVGSNLLRGKNITDSLIDAARKQLPGGPAAAAAFDAAVALAKGKNIQDAAFAAAGHLLPPSPYAAPALDFARKVTSGENIQKAALSTAGNMVKNRIEQRIGSILPSLPPAVKAPLPAFGKSASITQPRAFSGIPSRGLILSAATASKHAAPTTYPLAKESEVTSRQEDPWLSDAGRNFAAALANRKRIQAAAPATTRGAADLERLRDPSRSSAPTANMDFGGTYGREQDSQSYQPHGRRYHQKGRWVRRGNNAVLLGVYR
jgi:hypothetical protein